MGRLYGINIKSGKMELDDVPNLWRAVTEKWLKANT